MIEAADTDDRTNMISKAMVVLEDGVPIISTTIMKLNKAKASRYSARYYYSPENMPD